MLRPIIRIAEITPVTADRTCGADNGERVIFAANSIMALIGLKEVYGDCRGLSNREFRVCPKVRAATLHRPRRFDALAATG